MDECKLVADLLPTYCDELTGEETNAFIQSHLNGCPECGRLLEQMQYKRMRQMELDNEQEAFRAAMAGYQRRHRSRVRRVIYICLALIAAFFVFRAFSYDLAIASTGLREAEVIQGPATNDTGNVFQIVCAKTKGDYHPALVFLTKNALGFWTVRYVDIATPDRPYGNALAFWSESLFSVYPADSAHSNVEPHISTVTHVIYAGNNAIGPLDRLPQELIPRNVTVMTTQRSGYYYIHVTQVFTDGGSGFDIMPLLKEYNLIS